MLFCRVKMHLMSLVDVNQASHVSPDKKEIAFFTNSIEFGKAEIFLIGLLFCLYLRFVF